MHIKYILLYFSRATLNETFTAKFIPLSETASIPHHFHMRSPLPPGVEIPIVL